MSSKSRFLKAISAAEFTSILDKIDIVPRGDEQLPLAELVGRVLSDDAISTVEVPSFPKSSVDGYALKARATFGANDGHPGAFKVVGSVEMGRPPPVIVAGDDECAYVPTGGHVPDGADAVVKVEFTKVLGTGKEQLQVFQAVVPGDGVVLAGSDIKGGRVFLTKGAFITPARAGTLAAAGITTALAYKRLHVGLFSSGNEVVEPGKPLAPDKIYDVNSVMLSAMLEQAGCSVTFHGILADEIASLERAFGSILTQSDVVICSGGTSKGRGDLMPAVIDRHPGTSLQVHGVRVKPGKPIILAVVDGKPVFVLPGNPVSAAMTTTRLVRPALRRWNHLPPEARMTVRARLAERVYSEFGRLELKPVVLVQAQDGTWEAMPVQKGSETITTLIDAGGYFEIPENEEIVEKGAFIDVFLF